MRGAYSIFGQVHVCSEDVGTRTVLWRGQLVSRHIKDPTHHLLAEEILLERPLTSNVILQRNVTVCTESTWQYRNVPEDGLPGPRSVLGAQSFQKVLTEACQGY